MFETDTSVTWFYFILKNIFYKDHRFGHCLHLCRHSSGAEEALNT